MLDIPPINLLFDNKGAIGTAKGSAINQSNKHIDMRYLFIREEIQNSTVLIEHFRSDMQLDDPLTKALLRIAHERLCALMELGHIPN